MAPRKQAPTIESAEPRTFTTASDEEVRETLAELRVAVGEGDYRAFLKGQVIFYALATDRADDAGSTAAKAAFYAHRLAEFLRGNP